VPGRGRSYFKTGKVKTALIMAAVYPFHIALERMDPLPPNEARLHGAV
jgi:hypothetical protein